MSILVRKAILPLVLAGRFGQTGIDSTEGPVYFKYA